MVRFSRRFPLPSVILILIVSALLAACSGYQYVASPRYVPLNEKKGELTANLYPSGVQIGYSFTDHFSMFATGYKRFGTIDTADPFSTEKNHRSGDSREVNLGLSYFRKTERLLYEVLAGGGAGRMTYANNFLHDKIQNQSYWFSMEADKRNVFIQPNVSWKFGKPRLDRHLVVGVFTKVNFVQYYDINTKGTPRPEADPDSGILYFGTHTEADLLFIEPGVIVKGGAKNFKGTVQASPIINASGRALHYNMVSINIGFTMKLDLLKNKRAESANGD
jgi:hypothetical protein